MRKAPSSLRRTGLYVVRNQPLTHAVALGALLACNVLVATLIARIRCFRFHGGRKR